MLHINIISLLQLSISHTQHFMTDNSELVIAQKEMQNLGNKCETTLEFFKKIATILDASNQNKIMDQKEINNIINQTHEETKKRQENNIKMLEDDIAAKLASTAKIIDEIKQKDLELANATSKVAETDNEIAKQMVIFLSVAAEANAIATKLDVYLKGEYMKSVNAILDKNDRLREERKVAQDLAGKYLQQCKETTDTLVRKDKEIVHLNDTILNIIDEGRKMGNITDDVIKRKEEEIMRLNKVILDLKNNDNKLLKVNHELVERAKLHVVAS